MFTDEEIDLPIPPFEDHLVSTDLAAPTPETILRNKMDEAEVDILEIAMTQSNG